MRALVKAVTPPPGHDTGHGFGRSAMQAITAVRAAALPPAAPPATRPAQVVDHATRAARGVRTAAQCRSLQPRGPRLALAERSYAANGSVNTIPVSLGSRGKRMTFRLTAAQSKVLTTGIEAGPRSGSNYRSSSSSSSSIAPPVKAEDGARRPAARRTVRQGGAAFWLVFGPC